MKKQTLKFVAPISVVIWCNFNGKAGFWLKMTLSIYSRKTGFSKQITSNPVYLPRPLWDRRSEKEKGKELDQGDKGFDFLKFESRSLLRVHSVQKEVCAATYSPRLCVIEAKGGYLEM